MQQRLNPRNRRTLERGFSLIEALVALLVLSFGLLAIASFQLTLGKTSDLAKQRTEATRLAQQKMEQLRAYAQVASSTATPHVVNYTDDIVSSTAPEVITTNATFSRSWTVASNSTDTEKWVNVTVDWTDRANTAQQVRLFSVISKFDPQDIGSLATYVPGFAGNQLRPKNRNINVPYPAVNLANGTSSAFTPPPGNVIYIFDNNTGNITGSCTPVAYGIASYSGTGTTVTITTSLTHPFNVNDRVVIAGTDAAFSGTFTVTSTTTNTFTYDVATAFATTTTGTGGTATREIALVEGMDLTTTPGISCSSMAAYLLAGYVRFDTSNNPTGAEPGNPGANNDTRALSTATPLSLDTSNGSGGTPSMTCYAQRQKVVTTNSSAVSISSVSRSGSVVTVTAAGHGLITGDVVAINEVNPAVFSGAFTVTVTSASTFTYTLPPPLPTQTSGTGGFVKKLERLTIPETSNVAGYTTVISRFVSYACIVTPVDHDGSSSTPNRWWGRVTLNTDGSWAIGNGSSDYRVCRYSADYNGSSTISNSEHPLWYRGVTGALDSQNYLVVAGNQNCPRDGAQNLLSNPVNAVDDTTAGHQPSSIAELSFQCSGSNCGTRTTLEPSSTSTDLTMD